MSLAKLWRLQNIGSMSVHVSGSRVSLSSSWGVHQALVHVSRWLLKGLTPGVGDIYSEDLPLTSKYKICALFVLREWMLKKTKKQQFSSLGLGVCQALVQSGLFKVTMK